MTELESGRTSTRRPPPYSAAKAAALMGGEVVWGTPDAAFAGAAFDSRMVRPGELFFAIQGERADGHDYLGSAVQRGATCLVVSDWSGETRDRFLGELRTLGLDQPAERLAVIKACDTVLAVGRLARHHRGRYDLPVVGVTGSVGKTTAKDMSAHILEGRRTTLVSEGNLNSDVSLPVVLLRLDEAHQVAVLEMATRGLGQLDYLAQLARPRIGVITEVAPVHLETIGSLSAIAVAKAELLRALPLDGLAVYNADSMPLRDELANKALACPTATFGFGALADVRAGEPKTIFRREGGRIAATLTFNVICRPGRAAKMLSLPVGRTIPTSVPYPGRHNVGNVLAAAIAAAAVGVPFTEGLSALQSFRPKSAMRLDMSIHEGLMLIDDAYNANPLSMAAALDILAAAAGNARKAAILGDMRELGPLEESAHQELGRQAAAAGLGLLICLGPAASTHTVKAAMAAGMPAARVLTAQDYQGAADLALAWLRPGDALLIKGSRGMALERVVSAVRQGWSG